MIPLDYCSISELQSPTADKYQFELIGNIECFTNKVPHAFCCVTVVFVGLTLRTRYQVARYVIFDDNEAQVREWMKIVRYKCANCCTPSPSAISLAFALSIFLTHGRV